MLVNFILLFAFFLSDFFTRMYVNQSIRICDLIISTLFPCLHGKFHCKNFPIQVHAKSNSNQKHSNTYKSDRIFVGRWPQTFTIIYQLFIFTFMNKCGGLQIVAIKFYKISENLYIRNYDISSYNGS